jgi:type I restriction enzyme, S subunit
VSWEFVEAGELMARRNGSVDPAKFPDEQFELHSIPAFDAGRPEVLYGREIGSSKQLVQPDDVMISKIVPHIRRASAMGPSSGIRQIASGEWIVFRSERIFPHYLRHLLVSDAFNAKFMATVSGVGGSLLRARPAEVAKIKIPLPPLAEQRRIAAILDKADALRAKRREALAKLDQLLQSVFLDMFGDPVLNPKNWPVVKSGHVYSEKPRIGTTRPAAGNGCLVVRVGEVGKHQIAFDRCSRVELDQKEMEKFSLKPGDTVLARAIGSRDQLGKSSYFTGALEPVCIDSHVMRLRPDPAKVEPAWFNFLLSTPAGRRLLQDKGGATAVQFNINATQASDLDVPLPPMETQQEFVQFCSQVRTQLKAATSASSSLERLFTSLQQSAFSGAL